MIVTKFGGSSLSCGTQFKKVKNIIEACPDREVVVVSALGRRESVDNKLTDLLYLLHAYVRHGVNHDQIWETITQRFYAIKQELELDVDLKGELDFLKSEMLAQKVSEDYLVSRGEYLTAKLMADYLGYDFVDARRLIIFHPNGSLNLDASKKAIEKHLPKGKKAVVPGFYGAYPNGEIKLLNRGGSDITGAVLAFGLNAVKYENWTDVPGVLLADPRVVKDPVTVPELSYEELGQLSYMGASVLHEETIYPIRNLNIPIHIKNTNDPEAAGTVIGGTQSHSTGIAGIAGKKNYTLLTIHKSYLAAEVGLLRKTLEIFERFQVHVEHCPTGIDHLGMIVATDAIQHCRFELLEALKNELSADKVRIKDGIVLLTVVGRKNTEAGLMTKVFSSLEKRKIPINLITQGPKGLHMILGIDDNDYHTAIQSLYEDLVI
ncbi:MAG: aspartate kinase [Turicibacter sp.]|nr:aspartate kinase [Turicibacter sp.]